MNILVVGGGTMGAGIATTAAVHGHTVHVRDASAEALDAARARVDDSLTRLARRNEALDPTTIIGSISWVTTDGPSPSVDLVIEAIPEDLDLKIACFGDLESANDPSTILASNTSSLPIGRIAEPLTHPSRVIGLHFFNPVPVSSLVEIVTGTATDTATVDTCLEFVRSIDKTPIVVQDSPGFASSRLGLALGLEAVRMVEAGVASAADIDTAMELGYKHPMGPLRLTDLVGLDVRLAIAEHLHAELGDRFEPPQLLRDLVEDGHLGKKTGRGFHTW